MQGKIWGGLVYISPGEVVEELIARMGGPTRREISRFASTTFQVVPVVCSATVNGERTLPYKCRGGVALSRFRSHLQVQLNASGELLPTGASPGVASVGTWKNIATQPGSWKMLARRCR